MEKAQFYFTQARRKLAIRRNSGTQFAQNSGRIFALMLIALILIMPISTAYATEPIAPGSDDLTETVGIEPISLDLFGSAGMTPTGIPLSEVGDRLDALVAEYMNESTPGAAITIVKDGEIVFSRGYGYADTQRRIPVDPAATVFEYGSIGKLFIYVSIMQLAEQGLLDLDADIHTYLPDDFARELNFEKTFTLRDLLNHSAGFGEFFFNLFMDSHTALGDSVLRDGLLMSQPAQIFEPGTFSSYSNFGSALAAYAVTYVSGLDFTAYERTNILDIIGMYNTRNQPDWINDNYYIQSQAIGHAPDGRGGFIEMPWAIIPIYPAGALRGTAEDLARFAMALTPEHGASGPLFNSRSTLDLMLSPSYSDPNVMRGTLHGFMSYDSIFPAIGHGGGTAGFSTEVVVLPSERFGVVVLTNAVGANAFNDKVLDLLIGNSRDAVVSHRGDLPDVANMAGNFVMLRRHEGNVMEPLNFILGSNATVEAIGEDTISVSVMGMSIIYRQVEPYVFRLISSDAPIARMAYEIRAVVENGEIVGLSMSGPFDLTVETFGQSMTAFMINASILGIITLFFLVMSIIVFIRFLQRRGSGTSTFTHLSNGLMLGGALIGLNYLLAVFRLATSAPFIATSMVMTHVWINYILVALACILLIVSLVILAKQQVRTGRKVLFVLTVVFLAMLIFVLWNFNFFVIM